MNENELDQGLDPSLEEGSTSVGNEVYVRNSPKANASLDALFLFSLKTLLR